MAPALCLRGQQLFLPRSSTNGNIIGLSTIHISAPSTWHRGASTCHSVCFKRGGERMPLLIYWKQILLRRGGPLLYTTSRSSTHKLRRTISLHIHVPSIMNESERKLVYVPHCVSLFHYYYRLWITNELESLDHRYLSEDNVYKDPLFFL